MNVPITLKDNIEVSSFLDGTLKAHQVDIVNAYVVGAFIDSSSKGNPTCYAIFFFFIESR